MTPEGRVKAKIRTWLKAQSCYFFTPVGSAFGRAGVPDFIVCFQGRFIGIEAKAPGKMDGQTALQKQAQKKIEEFGGYYLLTDDAPSAILSLSAYMRSA